MPDLRTEVTEIVTGLGMTGLASIDAALAARPATMVNVTSTNWERLSTARAGGLYPTEFDSAWANGRALFLSPDGLRERIPLTVEWKGGHQPPGFDQIPADLRIDHVYLVSCKYQSKILSNSSPSNLFDRRLADRNAGTGQEPWYSMCALDEYEHFYGCVRRYVGAALLPRSVLDLENVHAARIRSLCERVWPVPLRPLWVEFSQAIANASRDRWLAQLPTAVRREEMLWRLLRLSPAPYFVLGAAPAGPLRVRIGTPWDWRQAFVLRTFDIEARAGGQPVVAWRATIEQRADGAEREIAGHVEVRWGHGRFSSVEAKSYLDTPHGEVAGYFPLPSPD